MKDFLKKNKIGLAVFIYAVLVGLFFYFIIKPLKGRIDDKASEIQQEKIDQDITLKKIMAFPEIEKDYQKYKENEENLNILLDESQEIEIIKNIESLAGETNNKIELKIQDPAKDTPPSKKTDPADIKAKLVNKNFLAMQIALEGDYQGLVNFIHKVENYNKCINIISIRTEKISLDEKPGAPTQEGADIPGKEVLNSILDVVVYIKK